MLPGVLRLLCRAWRLAALGAAVLGAGLLAGSFGGTAGAQQSGPTISSVSVSSSPANALFYLTGETIRFSVNFTSVVDVEGSPTLAVDVGGTEREAVFESVRGSAVLFAYTVTDDDFDGDGVSVAADSLSLGSGGAIADSGDRAASLTHAAAAAGAAHRVNMSVVTIAADSDEPVPENETAGFTLSRTGSLARELTVSLGFERRQYFVLTGQIPRTAKLQAGQATARFEVPLRNDSDVETEDGSLTMIVAEGLGYLVGSPGSAVAVLTDDNDILLGLVLVQGGDFVEGGSRSQARFGVTVRNNQPARDRPPDPIYFTVSTRNIDTTSTRDPSLFPGDIGSVATEVTVEPEEWQTRTSQDIFGQPYQQYFVNLDFLVTIYDDLEPEIPERFRVIVERSAATSLRTFNQSFPIESVFRIIDNEGSFDVHVDQPRVVDIVEGDVLELGLTAVSQFRFNPLGTASVGVDLEFVDGTASHGDDFVQLDRSTATTETVEITGFATVGVGDAERHQATSAVRISAVDNDDVQPVRQFVVNVGKTPIAPDDQDFDADECPGDPPPDTPACYGQNHYLDFFPADLQGDAGLSGYSMVVRIHDDDATPVAVTANESSIDEGGDAVFTVTRNPSTADLPDPLTVGFDITETADFIDYSGGFVLPTSVTIAGNATTATITIPTVDDNVGDGPGEIVATLRPGTVEPQRRYSYTLAGRTASVAVSEDEPVLTIADASVSEGAGTVDVDVTLTGTSADAVGFTWATAPATGDAAATAVQDYESAGGTVQIDAGDTSGTLTVTITDDALNEFDNETFHVVLSAVTGASVAQPQATVTIADNDALPEFSISDAAATEGLGASVGFTVSLDAASGRPTSVRWRAVSDEDDARPATEDLDYQGSGATLTIPAGKTEATVSVQLLDDGDHERTETFEVRLADPTNSVIADDTGEGRILDDDTPTISIDDLSVSESAATAQVTVRLSRPAHGEVTLRYGTAAGTAIATSDYTARSRVAVTVPAGDTTATVSVPILADDVYEADEFFFVDLSDPTVAELSSDTRAVITIVDDDAPPTLSVGGAQPVSESAGPLVFTVTRTGSTSLPATFSWSTADVTAEAGSDYTAASGTVTIAASSSTAPLSVTVLSDSVAEDDETVAVTLSSPINAVIIDGSATGVIEDDDQTADRTPGVVVNPSALTVTEGGGGSYTVELSSQPAADVTVAITGHSGTDLSLSGTSLSSNDTLTFTAGNWNAAQTVTVSAAGDDDAVADAAVALTHTATSGSHSSAPVAVTVTITETDTAEVLVDPADLTVAEDGSSPYTVRLATQPTANVTVTVTGHAGSDLTLSSAKLAFTPDNWGTDQTVTVTAAADDDAANDEVTLTHTASGGGYGAAATAAVDVTVADDDAAQIVVKPAALTMTEGGNSSYTVELSSPPTAEVTVTVSAPEADLTILSAEPRTLRFTPSDWDQPQTVTLAAGYDADTADDTVTLTHDGEGGGYDGQSTELPVTVTDTESRAELLVAPTSISIREGDSGGQTYSVALGSQPTGDVTVTITGHADSDLTLSGAVLTSDALTFTVTNWNTAQEVTVTAGQDTDTANDDETLTNTATGGGYGTATAATVAVTVVDNDTPGLVVTPTELRVTEGDEAGASYQISLASAPTGLVRVTITPNSTDIAATDAVWFTTTDWNNPQTITVTASDDPDLADEQVRLNHTVTSGSYAASAVRVQVTVEDDDMPGLVVNPQTLSMVEGASATYDVELTAEPSADVTVTISGHADTDLTLSGATLTAGSLTFTAGNWNQAQSVTATAGQDSDTTDDTATLTHTASGGGYDSLKPVGAPVTVIDDDRPRINVPAAVTVDEADTDGVVYAVRLTTEPSADVTVTISGHADTDVTLSGDTLTNNALTFTRSIQTTLNWGAPQMVTVTGGNDDDTANESVVLTHTATGGDYAGLTAQVEVTVVDDDEPEIILSHSEVTIDEADPDGAVYEVRLATEPSQQVQVEIIAAVGTDLVRTPESLTFDSSNWNTAQAVKVTAPPDVDTMHEEAQLAHVGSGGEYEGTTKTVTVIVQDDDIPGVVIAPIEVAVDEGDPAGVNYTVVLTSEPAGDVTVTISGHAGTDVTVSGSTLTDGVLTFTRANWAVAQTVKVVAEEDDDADGTLDTGFGTAGTTTTDIGNDSSDAAWAVALQPDGKIIAAGESANDFTVVRYNADGTLDTGFGTAGTTTTDIDNNSSDRAWAAALQPDGKIIAAGHSWADFAVVRYNADGTLDTGFGTNGTTTTDIDNNSLDAAYAVALQPDGKIIAAGDSEGAFVVVRYNADGTLDTGFGTNGTTTTDIDNNSLDAAHAVALQPDGKIIAAGFSGLAFALVRYNADGSLDTGFGTAGTTITDIDNNSSDGAWAVALQPDGKIIAAGFSGLDFAVVRYNADGSLDTGFGTNGTTTTDIDNNSSDGAWAVALQTDGKIIAAGQSEGDFVVVRYNADGSLDTGFGTAGTTTTDIGNDSFDVALAVALQPDGKIIAAGFSGGDFVVVRYNADDDVTLTHAIASAADDAYDALPDQTVTVTVKAAPGVVIAPTALTVDEGDPAGADYTVVLASQPAGDVTVTVSGHDETDLSIASAGLSADDELTFTTANWGTAQSVTVTAAEDDDAVTDVDVTLVHAIASTDDSAYDALSDLSVSVAITDNDAVGVMIDPTELTVVEGSSKSYSVELTSQPAGDVTVTVSGHSGTDVALSGMTLTSNVLTFTTANWGTAQSVTVTAAEDDDAVTDAAVTLAHAIASADDSAYDALEDVSVTVTITDDDAVGVDISQTALTVTEGDAAGVSYTVELTSQPAGDVTVTVSGHSGTDVALSGSTLTSNVLTFTTANWDTAQTVTVTAAEDDDAVTDPAVPLVHAVASIDDSDYDALADQTVTVTITDDDAVGVDISETALTVAEGSSKSYTVKLTSQPGGDVTVTVSGHSGTDVALSGSTLTSNVLTFTTANWDTAQTVTVTAAEDDDAVTDPAVPLVHAVASTDDSDYDALADQTVTVTITDDDAVGVDISESALTVAEGDANGVSYSVELTSEPAGDVTVTVSGHSGTDVGLSGLDANSKLTFTTVNWDTAQTVTVTAAEDDDAVTDPAVTLAHDIASIDDSAYDALADQTVTVTITDNDAAGVSINPTTLTVVEGSSKSYTVELTSQPAGDVTVTVSGHSGSDVGLSGLDANSKLTFTTENWNVAQSVTVSAAEDDDAVTDPAVTLAHDIASIDDSAYDALADQTVTVTITDNDAAGVSINPTALTVVEGSSKSYTVELTSQPAGDVTVTVSGHSGSDVGLSGLDANNVLTFTTANWNVAQTVTVSAAEDDDAVTDPAVTLAHAIASADDSAYDALADVSVTVTITDDDAVGVDISQTALTVTEGDAAGVSYTVELTSQPAGDVTVTVSGHSGTDVSLSGLDGNSKLTFTTVNWGVAQTVTVTAAEDDDAVTDAAVPLAHAIASADDSAYDALADVSVTVTITDDDAVGVDISQTALTVTEGDAAGVSYTVELTSQPAGDVTVTVSGHSGSDVGLSGLDGDGKLTFTTVNWGVAQTVTVTAAEDDDAVTDPAVPLVHAIASADDSAYDALADVSVTVTITDDDAVGVDISQTALTVTEGDAAGVSYTVELTSQPAGDVTVTVSGHSGSDVGLSGLDGDGKLTFTTVNWGVAQTVTVTAAEDDDAVTDPAVPLVHAIASADDSAYDALEDVSVTVTITDDDAVGVDISQTALTVTEGDAAGVSYTVELTSQPAGDVTVTVSGHSGSDVGLSGLDGDGKLTFTTVNWGVAQTVTVTAAEDDDAVTDPAVPLVHAIASADDSAYDALEDVSVTVTITDDDAVGVDISQTALTVTEGDAAGVSYTVELTSQPAGDVTVTVSGHSGSDVGLSGLDANSKLTFTTENWNVAQMVTVSAAEDDDAVTDPAVTLAHDIASIDDSAYDALADQTVTVTITDNDAAGVSINPTALTVVEGSSKSYNVELTSQPAGDVTVTVSGHSGTDVGLAGLDGNSKLTFTTVNWNVAQTVTVTAAEDDDAVTDPAVTLAHVVASIDDSDYDALTDQTVTVTITDDDAVGVDISETALTVAEGSSKSYTVELTSQPAGDVTVTVSGHSGTDVGLSGLDGNSKLTFTTVNWGVAQTVTVTAAEDDDAVTDPAVPLAHAIASADDSAYDALEDVSVTVTITDDDAVGVDISQTALTVTEGDAAGVSYTVELTSQPAGDVTVTVSGHSGSDVGLSGLDGNSKLTFTTVNWGVAQTVTVTAAEDDDAVTDPAVPLAHAIASADDSAYDALEDVSVTVTITDNDAAGVDISETALTVVEGSSKSYTVELTSQPAGDVTVTVSGHSGSDVGLSGLDANSKLTFTTANWNVAQSVTVSAAEDDDAVTDPAVTLAHDIASIDDSAYDALANQDVTVSITENDAAVGVTVWFEKDFHRTSEGAFGGAFATVRLSTASQAEVTIPIDVSSTTTAQTNDYELSTQPFQAEQNYAAVPVSGTFDVTFEAGDSVAYFAIRALPDTVFENDEKVVLEFGALPAGISTGNPSATTFHLIDTQTVSFGATSYSATEGGPGATVTVNLDYAPTGGAIVCLVVENQAGTSDDDYAGVPDELEFADTETSRSFVVTVADDTDSDGGSITVRLGCLTGVFREGSPSSTTVNLLDDDPPGGNPSAEGLPAPRGFIATFLMFDGHYYNKTQNSITLLWYPLDRAVQYKLEHRKTADGVNWAVVAGDFEEYTGGGDGPVAVAAGLECDTEYDFRLSAAAVDNADASGFGDYAETRARTGPCPEPELVTNLLVAMTPACATLHWAAPLDGRAAAYRVQRTDLGQQPAVTATLTASTAGTTFRHCPSGGYPPGSEYSFSVAALTADAEVYGQNNTQAVNAGPKGPPNVARNLRFTTQSPQVRSLAWDPPPNVWLTTVREATANDGYSDEVADPWVSYVVQRAELEPDSVPGHETLVDGTWHDLGEVTGTTFTDRENIGDRIFVYRVLTRNPRGGFAAGYDPEIWMER